MLRCGRQGKRCLTRQPIDFARIASPPPGESHAPGFFLIPILGDDRFGLAQRIFVGLFLSWLIAVAVIARLRIAGGATVKSRSSADF